MPRSPEQDALQRKWATVNSALTNRGEITTFGNCLFQYDFLPQQSVRDILSVGGSGDSTKVAKLMSAVRSNIVYATSPAQRYNEFVLLLHDDLGLTDQAESMVAACKACYDARGLFYESPLKSLPPPPPENERTESDSTTSGQSRRRNTKSEQGDEKDQGPDSTKSESTNPREGSLQCSKSSIASAVIFIIFMLVALYFLGYIPLDYSQEPNISLTSLSMELKDIEDWSNICTYFNIKKYIMNRIEDEYSKVKDRREQCLSAYLDSGRASWKHVVQVICSYPFYKNALGKKIAKKYNVPLSECEDDIN